MEWSFQAIESRVKSNGSEKVGHHEQSPSPVREMVSPRPVGRGLGVCRLSDRPGGHHRGRSAQGGAARHAGRLHGPCRRHAGAPDGEGRHPRRPAGPRGARSGAAQAQDRPGRQPERARDLRQLAGHAPRHRAPRAGPRAHRAHRAPGRPEGRRAQRAGRRGGAATGHAGREPGVDPCPGKAARHGARRPGRLAQG
ncbi:MAG: hypothetical protein BWX79_02423 [Alphaproteobacteria bacterium ADurb.Bin100]|nr:MAG: hypothetical protein BWX79_02423 [Alphaproteobacteria bacterium ADurb.Bin100]